MLSSKDITEALVTVVIPVITAGAFWNFLSEKLKKRRITKEVKEAVKKKIALQEGLIKISEVYSKMSHLEDEGAHRVLLFAGHNGGGIPRVTCGFWTSGIFSHYASKYSDRAKEYNNIPVDSAYVNMLIEVQTKSFLRFTVEEMAQSQLRKLYSAEGVVDSLVFFLGIHESKFMYMSVSNYERKFTEDEVTGIELSVQNIRTIFEELDGGIH